MDRNLARRTGYNDRFGRAVPLTPPVNSDWVGRWPIAASVQARGDLASILSDVTPQSIRAAFDAATAGYIGQQIELADTVRERDPHIKSLYTTRQQQVLSLDSIIVAGDDSDQAKLARDAFEAIWKPFPKRRLMEILLRAHSNQWSIAQILWNLAGKTWTPIGVRETDCRYLEWPQTDPAAGDENADVAADIPYIRPIYGLVAGKTIPLTPGSFVVHSCDTRDGRPGVDAPIRAIAMWWMFKRMAMVDWARFIEQFGMPYRVIKYKQGMSDAEVRALIAQLKAAASDMCLAIPIEAQHELVSMASSGTAPQDLFVGVCDRQISKAIVGSTTISDAATNNDSVSSPTHANVLRERRDGDANALEETINRDLIAIWCLWNFGPNVAAPKLQFSLSEKPDPAKRLLIWEGAQTLNLAVKAKQIYDELGIEMPADVDEVIVLKSAQAASPFGFAMQGTEGQRGVGTKATEEEGTKEAGTGADSSRRSTGGAKAEEGNVDEDDPDATREGEE